MNKPHEAICEEYLADPSRFLLVAMSDSVDQIESCLIYDCHNHEYHIIENDAIALAIKRQMKVAGIKVVTHREFSTFRRPVDEYLFQAIQSRRPREEIVSYLSSLPNPFI